MVHAISFNQLNRGPFNEIFDDVTESFPNFADNLQETCDDISENDFVSIVLELSGAMNVIQSRVIIKGSQECHASNTAWFVSGRVPGPTVMECQVTEEKSVDLRMCNLLCQCACGNECGFLHFRVQSLPWSKQSLSLCNFAQYYYIEWNKMNGVKTQEIKEAICTIIYI